MNRPRAVDFIDTDRPKETGPGLDYDVISESEVEQASENEIIADERSEENEQTTLASGAISKGKSFFLRYFLLKLFFCFFRRRRLLDQEN